MPEILNIYYPFVVRTLTPYARMEKDSKYKQIINDPKAVLALNIMSRAIQNPVIT